MPAIPGQDDSFQFTKDINFWVYPEEYKNPWVVCDCCLKGFEGQVLIGFASNESYEGWVHVCEDCIKRVAESLETTKEADHAS